MGEARKQDAEDAQKKEQKHHMVDGIPGVNMNSRYCTDKLMCLLFIGMIVVMIIIQSIAFGRGDLQKIATKYDMDGTKCPDSHPQKLFTRLVPRKYGDLTDAVTGDAGVIVPNALEYYYGVCVKECPVKDSLKINWIATKDYPLTSKELDSWDQETQVIFGFCMPSADKLN